MGLKNFFQAAKQEAIEQIVAERADKLAAERVERADKLAAERVERADKLAAERVERAEQMAAERVERAEQMVAEAETRGWSRALEELRGMTPEELADWLARETQDADGNGAGPS